MRQVVLDTETTGIDPKSGHKLIEIGCVELIDRKLTGNNYHQYINPQRVIEQEAIDVHGITNEFVADKPVFSDVVADFLEYVKGAELIIHNAPFDIGFLDHEMSLLGRDLGVMGDYCSVIDTLVMAKHKHPGQRNSLDALCRRYDIDNSHRVLHGALLDSEILADVYLLMTGGQTGLALGGDSESGGGNDEVFRSVESALELPVLSATPEENAEHEQYLSFLNDESGETCVWLKS